uniref:Uncharacterized protein n=1 Tax=Arundo donax TaxID=35708 RepID=A0A0A9A688_ARUDO
MDPRFASCSGLTKPKKTAVFDKTVPAR